MLILSVDDDDDDDDDDEREVDKYNLVSCIGMAFNFTSRMKSSLSCW